MARRPSPGIITARYGPRRNPVTGRPETHHGLDINSLAGLTLVAPEDGTLIGYGVVRGWEVHGQVARIQGKSGFEHWLSHTDRLAGDARVGRRLDEGDAVALQGMTGQTTGLHVHWETRKGGLRLNPEEWLTAFASTDSEEFDMPMTEEDAKLFVKVLFDTTTDNVEKFPGGGLEAEPFKNRIRMIAANANNSAKRDIDLRGRIVALDARLAAMTAAISALAASKGLDEKAVLKQIDDSVKAGLDGLTLTFTVPDER